MQRSGSGNCTLGNIADLGIAGAGAGSIVARFDAVTKTIVMTACSSLCLGLNRSSEDADARTGHDIGSGYFVGGSVTELVLVSCSDTLLARHWSLDRTDP